MAPASSGAGAHMLEEATGDVPTWQRLAECPRCILYRPHLVRTVATALVVGTVYFLVNQADAVLSGHASPGVWTASGATYLVPFCVSNIGLLAGCRRVT